jgi:hypothetical protein
MPPVGRPFPKGVSGNPQGRRAMPKDVRDALTKAAPASIRRVIELSEDRTLLENPKTAALYFAANVRVQTLTWGKDPVVVEMEGARVALHPIEMTYYSDEDLAEMERIESEAEQRRLAAEAEADTGGDSGGEASENEDEV